MRLISRSARRNHNTIRPNWLAVAEAQHEIPSARRQDLAQARDVGRAVGYGAGAVEQVEQSTVEHRVEPPAQAQFTFPVLGGIGDNDTDQQCAEHVASFLQVEQELGYLAKEISEVDTSDPENIRLVTQANSRALTLLIGDGNYARRYQNFLKHYPEIVKRSPQARIFDLRLEDRITVKE